MDEYTIVITGSKGGQEAIRITVVVPTLSNLTPFITELQKVVETQK